MTERYGDWLQTYSGVQFWPLDAREEEVRIRDIAHALAQQCRFSGHTRQFYSVAQHSVEVSRHCPPERALWGLLHDASEAYLLDLPTPLKHLPEMSAYRAAERRLQRVIYTSFGLHGTPPASVKRADLLMLATEAAHFVWPQVAPWIALPNPLPIHLIPLSPVQAEMAFLQRFEQLTDIEQIGAA